MEGLSNQDGLVNLQAMVDQLGAKGWLEDKSIPIVLVPGFSGWGSPLLGSLNYWGGIECLPKVLMDQDYTVIVAPIAPLSTNWERACELYSMLTFGKLSLFNDKTSEIKDVLDLDVNYGAYFDSDPGRSPETSYARGRRRAILFSKKPELYENWSWSEQHKVHLICHSQGGNTARHLISLMERGAGKLHPTYFGVRGRDKWIVSMTTLGTPHRGTTIINVLENLVQEFSERVRLIGRSFATIVYQDAEHRAYDLQLDHWGICRKGNETFPEMRRRFEVESGPVGKWLASNRNGFYDNSIEGVHALNMSADTTSPHIYYFSFSFHATEPFPTTFPPETIKALHSFPLPPVLLALRTLIGRIPLINGVFWAFNALLGSTIQKLEWRILSAVTTPRDIITWSTNCVMQDFLPTLNIKAELPRPGELMPRRDVIPLMMPTCYAMCGLDLTPKQRKLLSGDCGEEVKSSDWYQNDGIVNTVSMAGPAECVVKEVSAFPMDKAEGAEARGVFWHMGTNGVMDHADEIGVFIDDDTSNATKNMYVNLARLVSRLPSGGLTNAGDGNAVGRRLNGGAVGGTTANGSAANGMANGTTNGTANGTANSTARPSVNGFSPH